MVRVIRVVYILVGFEDSTLCVDKNVMRTEINKKVFTHRFVFPRYFLNLIKKYK